jgi:large conductance mechanosensitive channel
MVKDFKAFVMRGNVVDLAVGVIIGAAFGKVVTSLVGDVLMPPIGMLVGGINFTDIMINIKAAEGSAPAVAIKLGNFIQTIIDFLIVAFVIFMVVKAMARIMPKKEEPTKTKDCKECAMSIPVAAKRCGHCAQVQA